MISIKSNDIKNEEQLWDFLIEQLFSPQMEKSVKKCYASVPNRWKLLLESKGGPIKY